MKKCSVECCDRPHSAKGYCVKHYKQKVYRKQPQVILKNKSYKSSNTLRKKRRSHNSLLGKTKQGSWSDIFSQAKRSARLREIPWEINIEDYKNITLKDCFYCGCSLQYETGVGLDRVDNYKGYTLDNTLPCCSTCNKIRGNYLSVDEAKIAIQSIKKYRSTQSEIIRTKTGCLLVPIKQFFDNRGFFSEMWRESFSFLPIFKQENMSMSKGNVIRGIHFQKNKPQGKFVQVLHGAVTDVVVDLNPISKTFGQVEHFQLLPDNYALYIPDTHGHGFWAHKNTLFIYKCTEEYVPEFDSGISPLDKDMGYPWFFGNPKTNYNISEKDKSLPTFTEWKKQMGY